MPEVEADGGEQGVATIPGAVLQPVAPEQAVIFGVTDDGFDHRSTFQPAFDLADDSAFLAGNVNRSASQGHAMSLVF
ncbi:MAG TPA: hypothetical protein VNE63_06720 [Candidatus Acidoferrales bacterium]|nr:hypothetical protein [Candidatus Acidoferrales bacterium]